MSSALSLQQEERRDTCEFAGVLGFSSPEGWPGFELAGSLARRFWGRGYATEGARAALAHAFEVLRKDRVISLVRPDNRAPRRLVERLGQSVQGRTAVQDTEYLVYGIARESYAASLPGHRLGRAGCDDGDVATPAGPRPLGQQPLDLKPAGPELILEKIE